LNMSCFFGFHNWKYDTKGIVSNGSEVCQFYRCTKCPMVKEIDTRPGLTNGSYKTYHKNKPR